MRRIASRTTRRVPLGWIAGELAELCGACHRSWFGCEACYVRECLVMVLAEGEDPWNGVLVPCERQNHASLIREFPGLHSHPVLGKWLYLPKSAVVFRETVLMLIEGIIACDSRLGVPVYRMKQKSRRKARGTGSL